MEHCTPDGTENEPEKYSTHSDPKPGTQVLCGNVIINIDNQADNKNADDCGGDNAPKPQLELVLNGGPSALWWARGWRPVREPMSKALIGPTDGQSAERHSKANVSCRQTMREGCSLT